jgi:hypothetical protein
MSNKPSHDWRRGAFTQASHHPELLVRASDPPLERCSNLASPPRTRSENTFKELQLHRVDSISARRCPTLHSLTSLACKSLY